MKLTVIIQELKREPTNEEDKKSSLRMVDKFDLEEINYEKREFHA